MTDESKMPWGKYKGEPMGIIPADYLIWLYDRTNDMVCRTGSKIIHFTAC